jgi:Phage protein Gp19/Gp15/Gp42
MSYATPEDLALRWRDGQVNDSNRDYILTSLSDAEILLKAQVPGLDTLITNGQVSAEAVILVECTMVLRLIRSPGVFAQQSAGPFSAEVNRDIASGLLQVTVEDLAILGLLPYPSGATLDLDPWTRGY